MIGVPLSGAREAVLGLNVMGTRMRALPPVLRAFGNYMVTSSIPQNFRDKGRPTKWPASTRFGAPAADPLWDTGHLMRSVGYEVSGSNLWVGAGSRGKLQYAAIHQFGSAGLPGGVIRPRGHKYLTIPVFGRGRLNKTQARTMRAKDFPDAFPLLHGPEGPGLYIKGTTRRGGRGRDARTGRYTAGKAQETILKIFSFVEEVKIPPRPYLVFQMADVELFLAMTEAYLSGRSDWRRGRR